MPKLEKPKQKQGESDDAFKIRMGAYNDARHLEMLRTQSGQRIPRVVAAILSVGALSTHNPTAKQVEAIVAPLEKALAAAKERLHGKAAAKPAFTLPE